MLFNEVFAVVREDKMPVIYTYGGFCGSGVVSILQQFRQNMSWALNLLEELMPGSRKVWVSL